MFSERHLLLRKSIAVFLYITNFLPLPKGLVAISGLSASSLIAVRYLLLAVIIMALTFPVFCRAWQNYRIYLKKYLKWGLWVFFGTVILRIITIVIAGVTELPANQAKVIDFAKDTPIFLLLPLIIIAAPLMEELIFREFLFKSVFSVGSKILPVRIALVIAIVLSAGIFTWAHAPDLGWFEVSVYLPLALCLVWVYLASGRNVLASFTAHAINNAVAGIVIIWYVLKTHS